MPHYLIQLGYKPDAWEAQIDQPQNEGMAAMRKAKEVAYKPPQ